MTLVLLAAVLAAAPLRAAPEGLEPVNGPSFIIDLRYAGGDNFLEKDVYGPLGLDRCYVHRDLLKALVKAEEALKTAGLKLILWDCYRPLQVQRLMWTRVPDERYVADPKKGSAHNRGAAVDVSLADSAGRRIPMPSGFDDFTPAAAAEYPCGPAEREKCRHRDALRSIMTAAGLAGIPAEWWHFQLPRPGLYPIVPLPAVKK